MTKEDKEKKEAEIIAQYGEPSDVNDEPNEARIRINAVRKEYRSGMMKQRQSELNKLVQSIPEEKQKEYRLQPALPVYLTEEDLRPFNEEERKIVLAYFEDMNQSYKQIGNKVGTSLQKVTYTLRLPAMSALSHRAYEYLLKTENAMMLRKAQLEGDSKIITELAKKYGNLDKDSIDIKVNKPIENPALADLLRRLGDKLD